MTSVPTLQELFDPRGRASRSGLLKVALLLMAADVVVVLAILASGGAFTGPAALAFKLVSIWIATAGVSKRLHDLDISAWWIAKATLAAALWSVVVAVLLLSRFDAADALDPANAAFWINLFATATPMFAALIWLHLAPGSAGTNRYGGEAGPRGFNRPEPAVTLPALDAGSPA